MTIKYYLIKSTTGNRDSFYPVTQVNRTETTAELSSHLSASTGVSTDDINKVLAALPATLAAALLQGNKIEMGDLGVFTPKITDASVASANDPLPTTARVRVTFSLSKAMDDALDTPAFHRVDPPSHAPEWGDIVYQNGDVSHVNTSTIVKMAGHNFEYTASRADEGVFLYATDAAPSTAVKATVVTGTAQKLWWMRPDSFSPGTGITMELRTRGAKGGATATLETYTSPITFTAS